MNNSELFIERPWVFYILIGVIAALVLTFILFTRRRKTMGKVISLVLRCTAVALVFVILSGLGFAHTTNEQAVVLLLDYSDSTLGVRERIEEDSARIAGLIDENTPVFILAFGGGQTYDVRKDEEGKYVVGEIAAGSTDIGQALEAAAELLPDDHAKRIVLFSDGKQTDGSAQKAARILRNRGVSVDTVYYNTELLKENEVQLTSLDGPENVEKGETVRLSIRVDSAKSGRILLQVSDNNALFENLYLTVDEGANVFEITHKPTTSGMHIYRATLRADEDTFEQNNERYCSVEVTGEGKILIVAGYVSDAYYLQRLLKNTGDYDTVDLKTPYTTPNTIYELCRYDQIILMNVNASELPNGYDRLIKEYVSVYGKSLLTIGGNDTYSIGEMRGTAFDEILPVKFDYTKEQTDQTVALMLVLDCSQSMVIYDDGKSLYYAKESAEQCLDAVGEVDYVGIVSFNSTARVEYSIAHATPQNKELCKEAIWNIEVEHGTHYTPALQLAYEELMKTDADIKHVIFLSDGEPIGDGDYEGVANRLNMAGITITTIGLMSTSRYKPAALKRVAQIGNGHYFEVTGAEDLPELMLSEAMSITAGPLVLEESKVYIPHVTAETKDIKEEDIQPVNGYIGTTIKEDADAILTVGRGDPLLAKWTYGKGVISSFMSDGGAKWAESWKNDTSGELLFERMSSVIFDRSGPSTALLTEVRAEGTTLHVTTETVMTGFEGVPKLTVEKNSRNGTTYDMTPAGKNLYACDVTADNTGVYNITVTLYGKNGAVIEKDEVIFAASYSPEYDVFAGGGNEVMIEIGELTGGRSVEGVGADAAAADSEAQEGAEGENAEQSGGNEAKKAKIAALEDLAHADMGTITYKEYIIIPFAIAAGLLLLLDVLLRVLKFRDVKKFFNRRKKVEETEYTYQ